MTKELQEIIEKYKPIIKHFGIRPQIKKFNEEAFELIEALTEWSVDEYTSTLRGLSHVFDAEQKAHIAEEMADCLVLIRQFQAVFEIEPEEIERIADEKVKRTINRIYNENHHNENRREV